MELYHTPASEFLEDLVDRRPAGPSKVSEVLLPQRNHGVIRCVTVNLGKIQEAPKNSTIDPHIERFQQSLAEFLDSLREQSSHEPLHLRVPITHGMEGSRRQRQRLRRLKSHHAGRPSPHALLTQEGELAEEVTGNQNVQSDHRPARSGDSHGQTTRTDQMDAVCQVPFMAHHLFARERARPRRTDQLRPVIRRQWS